MKSIKDGGLITQLAVVATMMPKIKEYIDDQELRIKQLTETQDYLYKRHDEQQDRINVLQSFVNELATEYHELSHDKIVVVYNHWKKRANELFKFTDRE